MAEIPSLSEILNANTDPERGTADPSVPIDYSNILQLTQRNAQFRAQNQWNKYQEFLGNLKDLYKRADEISAMDTLTQDRPILQKQMSEVFSKIASDPRAYLGGTKRAEIEGDLSKLRQDATESKNNRVFDMAHRELLARNPDFATPENRAKIDSFGDKPLGSRKPYTLEMPGVFDPLVLAEGLKKTTGTPYYNASYSPDGHFIEARSGVEYKPEVWDNAIEAIYELPTEGKSSKGILRNTMQKQFKELPQSIQDKFIQSNPDDPAKGYYMTQMRNLRPQSGDTKGSEKTDQFALMDKRQLYAVALEGIKQGGRERLAGVRAHFAAMLPDESNAGVLKTYAGILGNTTGRKAAVEDKGKVNYEDELDITGNMNILKSYVDDQQATLKEGTSLDALSATIKEGTRPDLITRTNDGRMRVTFFKHYGPGDVIPEGKHPGDVITGSSGINLIKATGVIDVTNLLNTIGKQIVPLKNLGGAVDFAREKLRNKGNDFIDRLNKTGEIDEAPKQESRPSWKKYPLPKGQAKEVKQNGVTYTWNENTGKYE